MSALSRVPKFPRLAPDRRSKAGATPGTPAVHAPLSTGDHERLTEPAPKGDNRVRSETARKWLAGGSLDRDADDIAATVDRLVSALDSRTWMTPPSTPSKPVRPASGPAGSAGSRASTDDLSFAEGADFREVARRIAEFRQARPDPARAARPADTETQTAPPRAPASSASRPDAARSDGDRRASEWNADWRTFHDEGEAADVSLDPEAGSGATGTDDAPWPVPTRMRPLTRDDWPQVKAADRRLAGHAAPASDAPAPNDTSLRQRLAALRARSVTDPAPADAAPAEPAPVEPAPVVAARKPLDTSDAFAKAMLAQFETGDWLTDDDATPPDAVDFGADIDLAEIAPDPETPSVGEGEIETWAAADGTAQDVSNERLLAALDAHLAGDATIASTEADAEVDVAAEAAGPAEPRTGKPAGADDAEADRRLALETANRAEEAATVTGQRLDDLVDRLGRLEAQNLPGRFTALAERFDRIDARLAEIAVPAAPIDLAPVTAPMEALEARIARLEATTADQYASLCSMLSTVANRVAGVPESNKRLAAIEHHVQELARRVETHEVNLRAMKALAEALDRLEARLGQPRQAAPTVGSVPTAPRHPAAEAAPRAAPAVPRGPAAPDQSPSQGHAMSEREAILERYRRQSRARTD